MHEIAEIKEYISTKRFDRVIFCLATTEDVFDYALKKYRIKIITTGFMVKSLVKKFKEKNKGDGHTIQNGIITT